MLSSTPTIDGINIPEFGKFTPSSSKMKVAIFVLALVGAILAIPQDKPDIVGERQDGPIAERQDEPVVERQDAPLADRQDDPVANRMYGKSALNGEKYIYYYFLNELAPVPSTDRS